LVRDLGLTCIIKGIGVLDRKFIVWGERFGVENEGFKVNGLGFRVQG
jgi:hypothetical protein